MAEPPQEKTPATPEIQNRSPEDERNDLLLGYLTRAGKLIKDRRTLTNPPNFAERFDSRNVSNFDHRFQLDPSDNQSIEVASDSQNQTEDGKSPFFDRIQFNNLHVGEAGKEYVGNVAIGRRDRNSPILLELGIFQEEGIDEQTILDTIGDALEKLEAKQEATHKKNKLLTLLRRIARRGTTLTTPNSS